MAGPSPPIGGSWMATFVFFLTAFLPLIVIFGIPRVARLLGSFLGWLMRKRTEGRKAQLVALMSEGGSSDDRSTRTSGKGDDFDGIIGFFHPFCNAGGGGERVLWAAILATQKRWPKSKCVVYTGDHEVTKDAILNRVQTRFNIKLHAPTITFLYLSKRHWVLASTWPYFTLLGQSVGSVILAWDAFSLLVPDIFIDTMGYAFAVALCKFLFRNVPTGAYVHYPTISTDMLDSLDFDVKLGSKGINAGQGMGMRGSVKKFYWKLFARLYSYVGSWIDVVMTNSTWTQAHIQSLWGPYRGIKERASPITVVYPPCAVEELEAEIEVSAASEANRQPVLVYIAQFRPEKNHELVIRAFHEFLALDSEASKVAKLVLIGSVRNDADSKKVYQLRLLVNELKLTGRVEFQTDAPWPSILEWLKKASVGVNGMWNEHFGIGVVEYQAAGLISVVHNSGGPKLDIVTEIDGEPTGFHATTSTEFAQGYLQALSIKNPLEIRLRARKSAQRFTEAEFEKLWVEAAKRLIAMKK